MDNVVLFVEGEDEIRNMIVRLSEYLKEEVKTELEQNKDHEI
jgi:hypothetical protein